MKLWRMFIKKTTEQREHKPKHSVIKIKYDTGFTNSLYIRGSGGGLNWDKGILMENRGADEWVWETADSCKGVEFKVLINDACYEEGSNHLIESGSEISYTPKFE